MDSTEDLMLISCDLLSILCSTSFWYYPKIQLKKQCWRHRQDFWADWRAYQKFAFVSVITILAIHSPCHHRIACKSCDLLWLLEDSQLLYLCHLVFCFGLCWCFRMSLVSFEVIDSKFRGLIELWSIKSHLNGRIRLLLWFLEFRIQIHSL